MEAQLTQGPAWRRWPSYARAMPTLLLPPRYVGHEELFARTYRISGTCDVGLRKAWSWLREAFGFGKKKATAGA